MRRFSWRRAAALVPVAALGLTAVTYTSPAGAADPPTVDVGDVTIAEGDGGVGNTAKFAVTLSDPVATDTIVQWSITPGSATAGSDYVALKKPKLTKIRAGKTAAFASVKVLPDTAAEGDETFSVTLQAVTSGTPVLGSHVEGAGTIVDDDGPSGATVSVGDAAAVETDAGQPKIALPFTLSTPLVATDVYINWMLTPGTATENTDYKGAPKPPPKPKKTKIKAGKTNAQATITAFGDAGYETDETFTVNIISLTLVGAPETVDVLRATGTGTIINDDPSPIPPEAPTNVVASLLGGTLVGVDWDAPAAGPTPDGYAVEMTDDAGSTWTSLGTTGSDVTELQSNLDFGTYQFRVLAQNEAGDSPYGGPSNAVSVVPPDAPGAPTDVVAAVEPGNLVHVVWNAPTTGDAPDQYNYEYTDDGGTTWLNLGGGGVLTEFTIEMAAGTYQFRIQGENLGGAGPWSDPSNEVTIEPIGCDPFCPG
jgi:hypothetical protein